MIRPPGLRAAFSEAADGDISHDQTARRTLSEALGVPADWATVRQVHGADVIRVESPGDQGSADAIWTSTPQLPVAVFTADCFGVVIESNGAVGVAHAGWRGAAKGVVARLAEEMTGAGYKPIAAAVGPGIGPCCFEVGDEVTYRLRSYVAETTWGTTSVDLQQSIAVQLGDLKPWLASECTLHEDGWFSHRNDGTERRLATLAWL